MAMSYYEYKLRSSQEASRTDRAIARTRSNADTRIARIGAQYQNLGNVIAGTAQVLTTAMTQHFNYKIAQLQAENVAAEKGLEFGLRQAELDAKLGQMREQALSLERSNRGAALYSEKSGLALEHLGVLRSTESSWEAKQQSRAWFEDTQKQNPDLAFSQQWMNTATVATDSYDKGTSIMIDGAPVPFAAAMRKMQDGATPRNEQLAILQSSAGMKLGANATPVVRAMTALLKNPQSVDETQLEILRNDANNGGIVTKEWLAEHTDADSAGVLSVKPQLKTEGYADAIKEKRNTLLKIGFAEDSETMRRFDRQAGDLFIRGDHAKLDTMLKSGALIPAAGDRELPGTADFKDAVDRAGRRDPKLAETMLFMDPSMAASAEALTGPKPDVFKAMEAAGIPSGTAALIPKDTGMVLKYMPGPTGSGAATGDRYSDHIRNGDNPLAIGDYNIRTAIAGTATPRAAANLFWNDASPALIDRYGSTNDRPAWAQGLPDARYNTVAAVDSAQLSALASLDALAKGNTADAKRFAWALASSLDTLKDIDDENQAGDGQSLLQARSLTGQRKAMAMLIPALQAKDALAPELETRLTKALQYANIKPRAPRVEEPAMSFGSSASGSMQPPAGVPAFTSGNVVRYGMGVVPNSKTGEQASRLIAYGPDDTPLGFLDPAKKTWFTQGQ